MWELCDPRIPAYAEGSALDRISVALGSHIPWKLLTSPMAGWYFKGDEGRGFLSGSDIGMSLGGRSSYCNSGNPRGD